MNPITASFLAADRHAELLRQADEYRAARHARVARRRDRAAAHGRRRNRT
jgi:hypothetical protein